MSKTNKKRLIIDIVIVLLIVGLLIGFAGKETYKIIKMLFSNDKIGVKEFLDSINKIKAAIILSVLQIIQIVLAVLPSEFVQGATFITFKGFKGLIIMYGAVLLGSAFAYIFSRLFKRYYNDLKNKKIMQNEEESTSKALPWVVLLLYFSPAIPYGLISYYASSKKIGFFKYMIITAIGVIPSLLLTFFGTKAVTKAYSRGGYGILIGLLVIGILFIIIKQYAKSLDKQFKKAKYRRMPLFLFVIFRFVIGNLYRLKYKIKIKSKAIRKIKGPAIILSTHQVVPDFLNITLQTSRRINFIGARYYFYNKHLRRFLTMVGVYPKDLFNQDVSTIKAIMNIVKHKGIVGLMPEGRLSTAGYREDIADSTGKLIKKLGVDVWVCRSDGGYYSQGKGFKRPNRGLIELDNYKLFDKDSLKGLSVSEIDDKISQALDYDDNKWLQENKHIHYKKRPNMEDIPGILYYCPHCRGEGSIKVENKKMICNNCKSEFYLNEKYQFIRNNEKFEIENLPDLHRDEVSYVRSLIEKDDFEISAQVTLRMPKGKHTKIVPVGKGEIVFNKDSLTYKGTNHGEDVELVFNANTLKAVPFGLSDSFEIYRNGEFYAFAFNEQKQQAIKWVMFIEQNYKKRYA